MGRKLSLYPPESGTAESAPKPLQPYVLKEVTVKGGFLKKSSSAPEPCEIREGDDPQSSSLLTILRPVRPARGEFVCFDWALK